MKKQATVEDFRAAGLPDKRKGKPIVRGDCEAVIDDIEHFGKTYSGLITTEGQRKYKAALRALYALRVQLSVANWGR